MQLISQNWTPTNTARHCKTHSVSSTTVSSLQQLSPLDQNRRHSFQLHVDISNSHRQNCHLPVDDFHLRQTLNLHVDELNPRLANTQDRQPTTYLTTLQSIQQHNTTGNGQHYTCHDWRGRDWPDGARLAELEAELTPNHTALLPCLSFMYSFDTSPCPILPHLTLPYYSLRYNLYIIVLY